MKLCYSWSELITGLCRGSLSPQFDRRPSSDYLRQGKFPIHIFLSQIHRSTYIDYRFGASNWFNQIISLSWRFVVSLGQVHRWHELLKTPSSKPCVVIGWCSSAQTSNFRFISDPDVAFYYCLPRPSCIVVVSCRVQLIYFGRPRAVHLYYWGDYFSSSFICIASFPAFVDLLCSGARLWCLTLRLKEAF